MPQALTPYVMPRVPEPVRSDRSDSSSRVLTPEVVDPRIADVEHLARWLDYAFTLPGGFRFGFAGFIGLIPGIGDIIDAGISLYIVMRAIQVGIARVAIARMVLNVGIEALAGSVPFAGTLFDVAFKANKRNYLLLKAHLAHPERQRSRDWWFLGLTLLILGVAIALPILALISLLHRLQRGA